MLYNIDVTEREKYIYNCYLSTSRKLNNKPFTYRKNFEDFEEKPDYIAVNKLSLFFSKFPNINVKDFFEAPFFVYNEKVFDLSYFTSQKAIKAYTVYQTKFLPENPDHDQTLEKIKESFAFIYKFCKSNNMTLDKYTSFTSAESKWHDFMMHIKDRQVVIYALFVFPNFDTILSKYDNEIKDFVFGEVFSNINFYRTKYYTSNKAKKLCILAYNKLISNDNIVQ
jgi:hypothetical protein